VNNGIVLIDFINHQRAKGMDSANAIRSAGVVRLRPVLITALTTVFGMLPMAFSTSEGAEFRAPIAISVAGGLFAATALTLIVIPLVYSFMSKTMFKKEDFASMEELVKVERD
jgi:HAE1 family hydrophobic/amphiphilic exporter-1